MSDATTRLASLDQSLLADLVGDAVTSEIGRRESDGLDPMDRADERRFARSTLRKEIRRTNEASMASGHDPMTAEIEDQIIDETLNAVFGFGELERWLQDPSVQDIHINGFDRVFIKTRDGRSSERRHWFHLRDPSVCAGSDGFRQLR